MLDHIRGKIAGTEEGTVILDCGGLGLRINVLDAATYARMAGKRTTIPVWLDVQPRRLTIYGFPTKEDRTRFLSLMQIPGIGPAMAMRLVPGWEALLRGDPFPDIPGLGPGRRTRVANWLRKRQKAAPADRLERDLVQALRRLGLPAEEAKVRATRALAKAPGAGLEKLLRLAVRKAASR